MQLKVEGGAIPSNCEGEIMKLGDIKIEALKIMFVNYNTDLTIDELDNAMQDENYGSYLVNMPGAINRCFSVLEERRVLPIKSYTLSPSQGFASGSFIRFNLEELIDDYFDIDRLVCEKEKSYDGNVDFRMEGNVLVLPLIDDEVYTVMYYPALERVNSETDNETELKIPNKIAAHIPYFIKGDLYRDDEPDEANESRNWFEAAIQSIVNTKQAHSGRIENKYSQTEI